MYTKSFGEEQRNDPGQILCNAILILETFGAIEPSVWSKAKAWDLVSHYFLNTIFSYFPNTIFS